jgi:hypothetical protein
MKNAVLIRAGLADPDGRSILLSLPLGFYGPRVAAFVFTSIMLVTKSCVYASKNRDELP